LLANKTQLHPFGYSTAKIWVLLLLQRHHSIKSSLLACKTF
jgi:hypothetical protein